MTPPKSLLPYYCDCNFKIKVISSNILPVFINNCLLLQFLFQILVLITQCLAKEDFNSLEDKFTSEALEKARSIVNKLPVGNKSVIIFNEATLRPSNFSFSMGNELSIFAPWKCTAGEASE